MKGKKMTEGKEGGYQPSEEEMKLAEEHLTPGEKRISEERERCIRYISSAQEYAKAELSDEEKKKRIENDGGNKLRGFELTVEDKNLGRPVDLFFCAELYKESVLWPSYPRVYLLEDVIDDPETGIKKIRKGSRAVLTGGMGDWDSSGRDTVRRMEKLAEDLKSGKLKLRNLEIVDHNNNPL